MWRELTATPGWTVDVEAVGDLEVYLEYSKVVYDGASKDDVNKDDAQTDVSRTLDNPAFLIFCVSSEVFSFVPSPRGHPPTVQMVFVPRLVPLDRSLRIGILVRSFLTGRCLSTPVFCK
eukprot:g56745.t1